MPYLLQHYFDPDFNHLDLAPKNLGHGGATLFYLGYVQNVIAGQVLAESIEVDEADYPRDLYGKYPRFVSEEKFLPFGPNSAENPGNPNRIIATTNGYVFYNNDLITVKKMLNVRGDIDFHTGNILFVGDVAVHGDIRQGFSLKANNVLVKGSVDGGSIKAQGDVTCEAGVRGSSNSIIRSGGNVHLNFCENAQIRAAGNLVINGSCMHSTLYVGGTLVIKGRLQGGTVYANNTVYVQDQLGADENTSTKIMMGYDPFEDLTLRELDETQSSLRKISQQYKASLVKSNREETQRTWEKLILIARKRAVVRERRQQLWEKFKADEDREKRCRVVVPGKVNPGVEIAIGTAFTNVTYPTYDVEFRLVEDEIIPRKASL